MIAAAENFARAPLRLWGVAVSAILLTAALAWLVADRVALLASGTEVVLETAPIDPRDLFRGDYVTLTYAISRLSADELAPAEKKDFEGGDEIFVALKEGGDGAWQAVAMSADRDSLPADAVAIKGHVKWVERLTPVTDPVEPGVRPKEAPPAPESPPLPETTTLRIDYGIETYFVPEGEGRDLEERRNSGSLRVVAAVGEDGTAAIKALILDGGEPAYVEPLF